MEWVLLATAVAALQWLLETVLTARHERWRRRHAIPLTATQVRRFDSWLFALAVATLLYVHPNVAAHFPSRFNVCPKFCP